MIVMIMAVASQRLPAQTLPLVTEAWPPLVQEIDGKPAGRLWALSEQVLKRMGHDATLTFVPWKRALNLVAREQMTGVVGVARSPERVRQLQFPQEPLLLIETVVFSRRQTPVNFQGIESLKGLTVAVSAGYRYTKEVWTSTQFERLEVSSIDAGLKMVLLGRADAFVVDRGVGWFEARALGVAEELVASRQAISGGYVYLAFSANVPKSLVEGFDRSLREYRETPEYQQLKLQYEGPME
ncbi:substrate-binding periplasmic protein [Marinobacter caseinilyticus]|uniref:substrate-binding periplasmic protein n=1 Tax=Marinobacter caseinilyticus TaxID=2692195 RepID=UPI001409A692|nr:transporter substrate-binding domain-containing protein [Marinobacter caseinilyticus]